MPLVCIFWKYIQYTVPWGKTQILKKLPSDKINGTKICLLYFASSNSSQFYSWFVILIFAEAQGSSL